MSYSAWSVSFAEQPSASKWNILGTNDAYFNSLLTGSGTILSTVLTNPYKFYAYRSAGWTISNNSYGKVALNSKLFDTSSNFDSVTNNRFVAPVAGFYQFNGGVGMSSASGGALYATALYKNGVLITSGNAGIPGVNSSLTLGVNALLQLSATDYIELFAYGTGNAGATVSTDTFLSGYLVSVT